MEHQKILQSRLDKEQRRSSFFIRLLYRITGGFDPSQMDQLGLTELEQDQLKSQLLDFPWVGRCVVCREICRKYESELESKIDRTGVCWIRCPSCDAPALPLLPSYDKEELV